MTTIINGIATIIPIIPIKKFGFDLLLGYVIVSDDCNESGSSLPISSIRESFNDNCGAQRANVKGVSQKCFRRILVLSEAGALGRARRSHPIRGRPRAADRSIGENQDAWHFRLPVVRRATFTCIQTSRHLVTVNTEK